MALALVMLSAAVLSPFTDGTSPIWAPAGQQAKHVLLRPPTMRLAATPAKMTIAVSAAPDIKNGGKVLALYRVFVNGVFLGIGPGRSEQHQSVLTLPLYDQIDVPASILGASKSNNSVSLALQSDRTILCRPTSTLVHSASCAMSPME